MPGVNPREKRLNDHGVLYSFLPYSSVTAQTAEAVDILGVNTD